MKRLVTIFTLLLLITSCASVKRGSKVDLTPYLSETDARAISTDLVDQITKSPRIKTFTSQQNREPIVTIGNIKDETGEFFDTQIIANSLKTAILKSGLLEFMANKDVRKEMREEALDQADHARESAAVKIDDEDGADYMITGSVKIIVQNNGKKQERAYVVNIELTDLHTHRTVDMFEPSDSVKDFLKKTAKINSR